MMDTAAPELQAAVIAGKGKDLGDITARMQKLQDKADGNMDMKAIEEAAKEFEAVFLTEMMKPMFENVKMSPLMGGENGSTGEVYKSMMLKEYGKTMAEAGGIGLAEHVKAELIKMQETMQ